MPARRTAASATVAVLTATAFLTPAASAAAAPAVAQVGSYDGGPSCGRLDIQVRPNGDLKLKVGKPGRFAIAFAAERPCTLNVALRASGNDDDGGLVVGPSNFTAVSMPGTFTWTVTGTRKTDGFLAAYLSGGARFGIRLNDVTVR